ncbi:MAG: acyltransferase family protein, partial [Flavisolibacter sp.]
MQASIKSNYHYYEGLDAWRGIAVLAVMLSHYFITTDAGRLCWISVEMFFVLSGFLITGILVKNKAKDNRYFRNFYVRRALRIVPLYYLFLILFYLSIHLWHREELLRYYLVNWWYYPLFIQNWLFAFKGLPNEYYLNHLWTLSVE